MEYKKIPLSPEDEDVYLEVFMPARLGDHARKALVVIPGGGYGQVCDNREGEPIALAFLPHDFTTFVLHYSVGRKKPFPAQLIEAAKAIAHIKDHAEEYCINPDWVFTAGFSAGGHLAACTGTLWKHPAITEALGIPYGYNKPCGMMLLYPVIERQPDSFQNLLCKDNPTPEDMMPVLVARHVDEDTVPAFLMHTANDELVPVTDSLTMAQALSRAERPFEMHIYPNALHGVALGTKVTSIGRAHWEDAAIAKWVEHAAYWANNLCK